MDVAATSEQILLQVINATTMAEVMDTAAHVAAELRCIEVSTALAGTDCGMKGAEHIAFLLSPALAFQALAQRSDVIDVWEAIDTGTGREMVALAQHAVQRSYNAGVGSLMELHDALELPGIYDANTAATRLSQWSLTSPGTWGGASNGLVTASAPGAPDFLKGRDDEAAKVIIPNLDLRWTTLARDWGAAWDAVVSIEAAQMVADRASFLASQIQPGGDSGGFGLPPAAPEPAAKKSLLVPMLLGFGALGLILAGKRRG